MKNIIKKLLKLLTTRERKRLYLLFGAMIVSGIIGVLGIVSIMPFLSLLTNTSLINDNRFVNWFYVNLNFQSHNRFLIFVGAMVLLFLIISNVLIILTNWGLYRFSWMRNYTLSRRLLNKYIHQPYLFYLNKNTSNLGKNVLSEVQEAVTGVVIPLMQIFSSSIIVLFIFIMLIVIEPILALSIIIVLGGVYVLIYRIVKKKLDDIGKKRFKTNAERFVTVSECFGGIKQIKLLGCEGFFERRFSKPSLDYAKHNATNQIISMVPRYIMEIFAFGGIIILVIYLLATAKDLTEVLPLIGVFAFGAYRMMPSLQNIFVFITRIRFFTPALNILYDDIYSFEEKIHPISSSIKKIKPVIIKRNLRLEEITFNYPGSNAPVISNLNLKIDVNTSVAFVGKTGEGKTTLADIILGLLRPESGRILVDNVEITDDNLHRWQRNLGYIPQEIYLQDDTVLRNIAFGVPDENINISNVESAAEIANIHDFIIKELPDKYNTKIGERGIRLSGGQRQRIGIARALYHNPEVLVLDEATSSLDGATEEAVFEAIYNIAKIKTLIIIAHRLTTIKSCDIIYLLKKGKIVGQGKYDELMDSNEEFKKMARSNL